MYKSLVSCFLTHGVDVATTAVAVVGLETHTSSYTNGSDRAYRRRVKWNICETNASFRGRSEIKRK